MFTHRLDTLPSGLSVLRIPMPSVKSVTVVALVNTGSRYEEPHEMGIAHFLEHMVFKGTAKYEGSQELTAAIDAVGADFNAFTSKEYTGYYVKSDAGHVHLALDVISDMLLTPKLRQDDIDREKNVIIEEMNMYADSPARHVSDIFENMMFDGSGLGHDIIGTKETVSNIKKADFEKFTRQWYGLGNTLLVMAGDTETLSNEALLDQVNTFFTKGENDRAQDKVKLSNYFEQNPISAKKIHIEFKQTEQAHFILGFPGIDRQNPNRAVLSVLSAILGGNMSSRLFNEIREKRGLCYYVHSDADLYHNTGVFGASAGVDPKRVEEALAATIAEFKAIATTKLATAEEVKKAQDYLVGKMILSLEDSESVAQFYGMRQLLQGKIETPDEIMAKVKAVTVDQVHQMARQLIHLDQLRFTVIGPFKDQSVFETIINNN